MTHSFHPVRLNPVIHSPIRLSVMAALARSDEADFRFLKRATNTSDSLLSKHLTTLESAGYIEVTKGYIEKRPTTWLCLTPKGKSEYQAYRLALQTLLDS